MKVVATYNIKGGVGKTSAAVNLAALAAASGQRTLLWDLDPQGAATFLLRVKPRVKGGARRLVQGETDAARSLKGTDVEGLDLLPADFSNRHMDLALGDGSGKPTRRLGRVLAPLAEDYDVAILDCPPSISLVSENVFDAADALLVPLIPTTLSLRTYEQLAGFVRDEVRRPPVLVPFFSMVDGRKRLHREIIDAFRAGGHEPAGAIPARTEVELMGINRAPLSEYAPRGTATRAYAELWDAVRLRLGL